MVRLETERLLLRPFADADFDAYAILHADPEVMRFLTGSPLPRWEAWRSLAMFVGHWQLRGYGVWAVEGKATGAFAGRAGLFQPGRWPAPGGGRAVRRAGLGQGDA